MSGEYRSATCDSLGSSIVFVRDPENSFDNDNGSSESTDLGQAQPVSSGRSTDDGGGFASRSGPLAQPSSAATGPRGTSQADAMDYELPAKLVEQVQKLARENDILRATLKRNNDVLKEKLAQQCPDEGDAGGLEAGEQARCLQQLRLQETEHGLLETRELQRHMQRDLETERRRIDALANIIEHMKEEMANDDNSGSLTDSRIQLSQVQANLESKSQELLQASTILDTLMRKSEIVDSVMVGQSEVDGMLRKEQIVPYGAESTYMSRRLDEADDSRTGDSAPPGVSHDSWQMVDEAKDTASFHRPGNSSNAGNHSGSIVSSFLANVGVASQATSGSESPPRKILTDHPSGAESSEVERLQLTIRQLESQMSVVEDEAARNKQVSTQLTEENIAMAEELSSEQSKNSTLYDENRQLTSAVETLNSEKNGLSSAARKTRISLEIAELKVQRLEKEQADTEEMKEHLGLLEEQLDVKSQQLDYMSQQLSELQEQLHDEKQLKCELSEQLRVEHEENTQLREQQSSQASMDSYRSMLEQRNQTINEAKREITSLTDRMERIEKEKSSNSLAIEETHRQITLRTSELQHVQAELQRKSEQLQRSQDDKDKLTDDLKSTKEENNELKHQLTLKEEEVDDLRADLERQKTDSAVLSLQSGQGSGDSDMSHEVRARDKSIDDTLDRLKDLQERFDGLQKEKKALQTTRREQETKLEDQLELLRSERNSLAAERDSLLADIEAVGLTLRQTEQEKKEFQARLSEKERMLAEQLEQLRKEKHSVTSEKDTVVAELELVRSNLHQVEQEKRAVEEGGKNLRNALLTGQTENDTMKTAMSKLETGREEQTKLVDDLRDEVKRLQKDKEVSQHHRAHFRTQLDKAAKTEQGLRAELETASAEVDRLKPLDEQRQKLQRKLDSSHRKIEQSKKLFDSLYIQRNELEAKYVALARQHDEQLHRLEAKENELHHLQQATGSFQKKQADVMRENADLQQRMARLSSDYRSLDKAHAEATRSHQEQQADLQKSIHDAKLHLSHQFKEADTLRRDISQLSTEHQKLSVANTRLQEQLQRQLEKNDNLKRESESMEKLWRDVSGRLENLTQHLNRTTESKRVLEAEHERIVNRKSAEIAALEEDIASCKEKLQSMRNAAEHSHNELEAQKAKASSYRHDYDEEHAARQQLQAENNRTARERDNLREDVELLRKEMGQMKKEFDNAKTMRNVEEIRRRAVGHHGDDYTPPEPRPPQQLSGHLSDVIPGSNVLNAAPQLSHQNTAAAGAAVGGIGPAAVGGVGTGAMPGHRQQHQQEQSRQMSGPQLAAASVATHDFLPAAQPPPPNTVFHSNSQPPPPLRALDEPPSAAAAGWQQPALFQAAEGKFHQNIPAEAPTEFQCPKCNREYPDFNSLQMHVLDCIR